MEYDWIRNRACKVDGIEHTITYRMKKDRWDKEVFSTLIIKNHPTDPEVICSFNSTSSAEMYEVTERKLNENAKDNYVIGDYIE
jgi:hypothetical protein